MKEAHTTFPNKLEAFLLVAGLFGLEIVASYVMDDTALLDDVEWQGVAGFNTVVGNGLMFIFLTTFKRLSYRSLFHPTANSAIGTLGTLVVPLLMIVPGLGMLTGVLNLFVVALVPMSENEIAMFGDMARVGVIPILFGCVLAPLLEEMLFRGIIFRSFLQQYSRAQAILWSSLIFGLAHLNAYQLVTAFVLGVVFAWLYERTRSLWPSIFLHAAFNLYVTASASGLASEPGVPVWYLGAVLISAIVGGRLLWHLLETDAGKPR